MKGWVYIISNQAMPGLIKIGHSTKDPLLRAKELNNTGSPHPYNVDYEMLIEDPMRVEKFAHTLLSKVREGREWFRCSCEEAIAAIQQAAGGQAITESFKYADRARAEQIRKDKELAQVREKWLDKMQALEMLRVRGEWDKYFAERFPAEPFWVYWLFCSFVSLFAVSYFGHKNMTDMGIFFTSSIVGAIIGTIVQKIEGDRKKESPDYKAAIEKRELQLREAAEFALVACPNGNCKQQLRLAVRDIRSNGRWTCPKCRWTVLPKDLFDK